MPVTLVAVSKRQPDDKIDAALAAGQRVFGENRVPEPSQRWFNRLAHSDLTLHLIGPLQANKVPKLWPLMSLKLLTEKNWRGP